MYRVLGDEGTAKARQKNITVYTDCRAVVVKLECASDSSGGFCHFVCLFLSADLGWGLKSSQIILILLVPGALQFENYWSGL